MVQCAHAQIPASWLRRSCSGQHTPEPQSRNCPVQDKGSSPLPFQKSMHPMPGHCRALLPFAIAPRSYCKVTRDWPMGSPELLLCVCIAFPPSLCPTPLFSLSCRYFVGGLQITLLHTNVYLRAISWGT